MDRTSFLQRVICRPALDRDLEEIKEFCRITWDGHDYIADVIDDWLHDPRLGLFAVTEYEGQVIAWSKLTWLAPVHKQSGYSSDWENTAYIFEKSMPPLHLKFLIGDFSGNGCTIHYRCKQRSTHHGRQHSVSRVG